MSAQTALSRGGQVEVTRDDRDRPLRVFVVDDDVTDHLMVELAAAQADAHLELDYAVDGSELLAALDTRNAATLPHLVLLDLRMPGVGGHEVLAALRDRNTDVAVCVLSASSRPGDEHLAFELGADWYEPKPTSFQQLVRFVAGLPERHARRRSPSPGSDR